MSFNKSGPINEVLFPFEMVFSFLKKTKQKLKHHHRQLPDWNFMKISHFLGSLMSLDLFETFNFGSDFPRGSDINLRVVFTSFTLLTTMQLSSQWAALLQSGIGAHNWVQGEWFSDAVAHCSLWSICWKTFYDITPSKKLRALLLVRN